MNVCYWGTYDRDYPRNRILMEGLRREGVDVREIHFPLWGASSEKVRRARGGWLSPALLARWAWAYLRLAAGFLMAPKPDFLFVGYSGHFDVFPAWCLSRIRGVPLVFDAFLSLYDSLVLDRGSLREGSFKARLLAWIDRSSCGLADRVLLDTEAHVRFFCEQFGLPREKFWVLPIGADDTIFRPAPLRARNGHPLTILHFGRYIPLHGLETVVRAAALMERSDTPCRFLLVGDGEERPKIEALARELGIRSIEFRDAQAPQLLAQTLLESDVCLGIFGTSQKASRVVPNKVYEAMAVGRPIVTGDSPAAREVLKDGIDCVFCERGNPASLAEAIRRIQDDSKLARRVAEEGRRCYERIASPQVIGRALSSKLIAWHGEHGLVG
jgi:glycosyltransferase involved in cell wall biosynthesis